MDAPDFINGETLDSVQQKLLVYYEDSYEALSGVRKAVQPAQAEMLLLNSVAYIVYTQGPLKIQSAATQGLLAFASYPALDEIAQPFGVERLLPTASQCSVNLVLNAGHGDLIIDAGTRVQSDDGLATFEITRPVSVPATVNLVSVVLTCDTPGAFANGYPVGKISVILDPKPYLASAVNTDITSGGSDGETDDQLRERVPLSNTGPAAGSDDQYRFLAKSASPLIQDVAIDNAGGGVVNIYPLVLGGETSPELLAAVEAACRPKDKRPTSDLVSAISPEQVTYNVDYSIVVYGSVADPNALLAASKAAVKSLTDSNAASLGVDTIVSQLVTAGSLAGVYKLVVNSPAADVVVNSRQVAVCAGVNAVISGFNYDK